MSWGMVAVGVGTAVVGAVGQNQANKQAKKAAQNQGFVDQTTTRTPMAGTAPYRDAGQQAAYEALFGAGSAPPGQSAGPAVVGDPRGAAAAGPAVPPGGTRRPDGRILNAQGQTVYTPPAGSAAPARAGRGGGGAAAAPAGPAGPAPAAPFAGMSQETDAIRGQLMGLPAQNAGMFNAAESFTTDTLGGTERNAYRGEAADAARAIAEDPGLAEYIAALKGDLGMGGGNSGGKSNSRNVSWGFAKGASGSVPSPAVQQASSTGADAALRKILAGEDAPGLKAAEDAIARKVNEGRAGNIRELRARAVGSGFYGGDVYKDLEEGAIARGDMEMADSLAAARFGTFQEALGLGTQYDLGMADLSSRERIAAQNASSAGAGAAADAASRERLATLGMWGDALGLGQQGRTASAGALGDLAGLTSADQRAALEGINALGGSRRADLGAAGELSLGSDAARNQFAAARGSERVGMAGVNLGSRELAFDRERFYDPFARISAYGDALNSFSGAYGSETTSGRDTRSTPPPAYSSPWGAALTGAAIGGQLGGSFQSARRPTAGDAAQTAALERAVAGL